MKLIKPTKNTKNINNCEETLLKFSNIFQNRTFIITSSTSYDRQVTTKLI